MFSKLYSTLFFGAVVITSAFALPSSNAAHSRRAVTELKQDAFDEAQQVDATATRPITGTEIKVRPSAISPAIGIPYFTGSNFAPAAQTSNGQCLFVDKLSGDFRANLTPIQVATCDGSQGQKWDVITAGKHNNQAGAMLVVSGLTNACMNFDSRRPAGNQVILFSCGGRADGGKQILYQRLPQLDELNTNIGGQTTDSQLFDFQGGASGPRSLSPLNTQGKTCFAVKGGAVDQAGCANGDASQQFTFGGGGGATGQKATTGGNAGQGNNNANAGSNQSAANNTSNGNSNAKADSPKVAINNASNSTGTCGGS